VSERRPPNPQGEGSASLTPSERQRVELGALVRQHRKAAGLDQTELGNRSGLGQSAVSKVESARVTPTPETLGRLADALELSGEARTELLDHLALLETEITSLRVRQRRGQRWAQEELGTLEAEAKTIAAYQLALVPGLLQTAEYARSMLSVLAPHNPDPDGLVAGRLQRQQILYDPTRHFRFLMTEAAVRASVGAAPVLRGQFDRILALAGGFDHIEIAALPMGAPVQAYSVVSFDILGDVVVVELPGADVRLRDQPNLARYSTTFEGLWRSALRGADLVTFLRAIDRELAGIPGPGE
jgi:transcriptional regulator with XRE-family HTH domain